jgi:hypothetical protein
VPNASTGTDTTGGIGSTGTSLTGPAADLLNKSQQAMKDLTTFHYVMEITSEQEGMSLTGEGDFEKPDKVRISMKGITGTVGTIEMIIVGSDTYMKQPGSEQYMSLGSAGTGLLNLGRLSNPGETAEITQFADSADIVGDETLDGTAVTHVTFTYDVDKAMQAAGQQAGTGATALQTPTGTKSKADAWIAKDTNYIRKMAFITETPNASMQAQPIAGTSQSTVSITYSKFNEPVSPPIEKPTNVITLPSNLGTPVP